MATKTIEISEAEHRLAELVDSAAHGEDVVLTKDKVPLAKIVPVTPAATGRVLGLHQGHAWLAGDFDAPLPESFWIGGKPS